MPVAGRQEREEALATGRLAGQMALVTGAARRGSIGRATALALAAEGADLALNDLPARAEEAGELAGEIEAMGRRACPVPADVSDVAACRTMVAAAIAGLGRLDILVNNAGGDRVRDFLDIDEAFFDAEIALNLKAPFFVAQAAARHMLAQGGGRIVNIASELGYLGEPSLIPYSTAKGGLLTMTKALARALAPRVTVNAVAPGPTATDEFKTTWEYSDETREALPLRRFVEPGEVARSVVFLASPDGAPYTGQTLDANAGAVMD